MNKLPHISRTGRRTLKSFLRNRRGVTVVEFALLFPLFMLIVAGILENGIIYFRHSQLQNVVENASREIRLGKVSRDITPREFKQKYICDASTRKAGTLGAMFDCNNVAVHIVSQDYLSTPIGRRWFGELYAFLVLSVNRKLQALLPGPDEIGVLFVAYRAEPLFPSFKNIFLKNVFQYESEFWEIDYFFAVSAMAAFRVESLS